MDRAKAIEQLKDKPDSCYLVRDSVKESEDIFVDEHHVGLRGIGMFLEFSISEGII